MSEAAPDVVAALEPRLSGDRNLLVQSWYPLMAAASVPRGKSVPLEVLGHALVVFRNQANQFGVVRRHCCHMGGDLSRGRVTKNGLRCPIHGWEFDVDGARLNRPQHDKTPPGICQPSLPCIERYGIVFAFFGPRVLFELPLPGEAVFRSGLLVRDLDARYDAPTIFGFDSEHFTTVHNRGVQSMEIYTRSPNHLGTRIEATVDGHNPGDRIMRAIGSDAVETDIDFWGANLMLGHHKRSGTYAFLASLPLADDRCRMFVTVMQKRPDGGAFRQWLGRLRFFFAQPVLKGFVAQDETALTGVRFDPERSALTNNPGVQRWLEHYRALPKIAVEQIFATG